MNSTVVLSLWVCLLERLPQKRQADIFYIELTLNRAATQNSFQIRILMTLPLKNSNLSLFLCPYLKSIHDAYEWEAWNPTKLCTSQR